MNKKDVIRALDKVRQMRDVALSGMRFISEERNELGEVSPEFALGYATGALAFEDIQSPMTHGELVAYARGYADASELIAENNAASLEVVVRLLVLALEEAV